MIDGKIMPRGRPKLEPKHPDRCGFDAEFKSGLTEEAPTEDVWYITFASYDDQTWLFKDKDGLRNFLEGFRGHKRVYVFGFNMLADLGCLRHWGIDIHPRKLGNQVVASLRKGDTRILFQDLKPLADAMKLNSLEAVGKVVGYLKRPNLTCKTEIGCEHYPCPKNETRWACSHYARDDSIITYRFAEYVRRKLGVDPARVGTIGRLALHYFPLPKRLSWSEKEKRLVECPEIEWYIRTDATYAGRSETFYTGYIPQLFYNDIKSLYPVSIVVSRCLFITRVEPCNFSDLDLSRDPTNLGYGWIEGTFRTDNDLWGLPYPYERNYYVVGTVKGFYHTHDLASADAEVLEVKRCFRPYFDWDDPDLQKLHNDYRETVEKRLTQQLTGIESSLLKAGMNALGGQLGRLKPFACRHTNFPAYSSLLATSHLIMSNSFAEYIQRGGIIYGMDTDSIMGSINIEGIHGTLDGLPVIFHTQAEGEGALFRPKRYIIRETLEDGSHRFVSAKHGWRYDWKHFDELYETPDFLETTKQVRRTLKVREKLALTLEIGHWFQKPVRLENEDLRRLLSAGKKRQREKYDSYELFRQRKSVSSKAHVCSVLEHELTKDLMTRMVVPTYEEYKKQRKGRRHIVVYR
jgi:hypothetical protein